MNERKCLVLLIKKIWIVPILAVLVAGCAVTSDPISQSERNRRISMDLDRLFADQEPVRGGITVYEAIARAIKYNLDHRVNILKRAVALRQLDMTEMSLLPQLAASAGYTDRSNDAGASSQSLLTGTQSLESSTSQERQRTLSDLTIAWNVLDFGVSYVNAQQRQDEIYIAEEQRRKTIQNITQDVIDAYWRAWNAQRLLPEMDTLIELTDKTIGQSRALIEKGVQDKKQALNYQRNLLETRSRLWKMRERMALAKIVLSRLMNLHPGTDYALAMSGNLKSPASFTTKTGILERRALADRPDLREEDYRLRINQRDVTKAMLRMFPGIEINAGTYYDSNKFLFNNDWSDLSLRISWNLFNVFGGFAEKKFHETRVELANARRMALSMAVLVQVRLAVQRYELARQTYRATAELADVDELLFKMEHAKGQTQTKFDVIRAQAVALSTKMRKYLAYAETQKALARVFNSIGADPLPETLFSQELDPLSAAIEKHWNRLLRAHLNTALSEDKPPTTISQSAAAGRSVVNTPSGTDADAVTRDRKGEPEAKALWRYRRSQNPDDSASGAGSI